MSIKAIETYHNGRRFRSRLEARWAVFFEILGIDTLYEPEGYDLNGIPYLPDFLVPDWDSFVEIKPTTPTHEERRKAECLQFLTNSKVYIFSGEPWNDKYKIHSYVDSEETEGLDWYWEYIYSNPDFAKCTHCDRIFLIDAAFRLDHFKLFEKGHDGLIWGDSTTKKAYNAARSARFGR